MTASYMSMPVITEANMRQTYHVKIRYGNTQSSTTFELYQGGQVKGGYGTDDDRGPVIKLWRDGRTGHIKGAVWHHYPQGDVPQYFDLGFVAVNTWHTFTVKAIWSHDPRVGRLELSLDGVQKAAVSGRDVNMGRTSTRLPELKLGLYGDYAVGVIDVDDVVAGPTHLVDDEPAKDTSPPSVPSGCTAVATDALTITMTCQPSTDDTGVTGYVTRRCLGESCQPVAPVASNPGYTHISRHLSPQTVYGFTMAAFDAGKAGVFAGDLCQNP